MLFNNFEQTFTPRSIDDIVYPDEDSRELISDLISGNLPFPISEGKCGILLYGIPGTGKSALAKLLPNAIERARSGQDSDEQYIRIQPGSNGLILLQRLADRLALMPLSTYHYTVLDEVDNLNSQAMATLKSVMNTPQTVWILTTNKYQSIESGIVNRCHSIAFNAAKPENWLPLAHKILDHAGVTGVPDDHLINIVNRCNGSARDIITAITRIAIKAHRKQATQDYC